MAMPATAIISASSSAPIACAGWTTAPRADNELEAVVRAIEYTGSLSTISLSLPTGGLVKMEQHESLLRHRAPRHGETLRVGWDADDGFVLPEITRPRSRPEWFRPRGTAADTRRSRMSDDVRNGQSILGNLGAQPVRSAEDDPLRSAGRRGARRAPGWPG